MGNQRTHKRSSARSARSARSAAHRAPGLVSSAVSMPAVVRSHAEQRAAAAHTAAGASRAAASADVSLAQMRQALEALAYAGEVDPAEAQQQALEIDETRAALATLQRLAPMTLARSPDLMEQAQGILSQAHARSQALDALPPDARRALLRQSHLSATSVVAATGDVAVDAAKGSPTQSTPIASGESAGVAWAGLGARRTDAMGVPNADYLRRLATRDPWIQAAISARKQQIGRADIAVVPLDETKPWDKKAQSALEGLLNYPNELRDSYRSLIEPVIDDILTLDRGCISKDLDARGVPHHLYYEDGATIKIVADWQGDPKQPHYVYQPPNTTQQTPLYNEQIICIMANAASYRFGLSPVQVLMDTIRADLAATQKATNLVNDVPPPHLINLQGANQKTLNDIRNNYQRDIAGQRELLFMGWQNGVQVYPMMFSLKDNQFLEWQTYLARKICAVFQISPQAIGLTFDINKATAEVQQDITEDNGLIPLLLLIEEYWNRELVADFARTDRDGRPLMDALNLGVLYPEVSEVSRMLHAERVLSMASKGLAGLPLFTPNMALKMLGEEPVPGGNTFWVSTKQGPEPWLSYDGETGDYGRFATAGDLGAQAPSGGVDDEADDPAPANAKADRSKPQTGAEALGNESSANGAPPESGATTQRNDAPGSSGNDARAHAAAQVSPAPAKGLTHQPPVRSAPARTPAQYAPRRDGRKPGKAWSPAVDQYARQLLAAVDG